MLLLNHSACIWLSLMLYVGACIVCVHVRGTYFLYIGSRICFVIRECLLSFKHGAKESATKLGNVIETEPKQQLSAEAHPAVSLQT